jgi:hypothetical protein
VNRRFSLLIACALGCTDGDPQGPAKSGTNVTDDGLDHLVDPEPPPVLPRGLAPAGSLTEVWLEPRAEAALTLDTEGVVQLWPALAAEQPDDTTVWPLTLPLHEPLWLSFAKTKSTQVHGSFLIAAIDTGNAMQVFEVFSVAGKHVPHWEIERRFALPPSDPMLEAHVLAGGERIVALGEDHRIRIYDRDGKLVSELSQPNFVPWQLRVGVTDDAGRTPMAVILSQPLRVQALVLVEDQLRLEGEARTLELDRGPNRNDLELSPDGRTVAALRRARGKGKEWSVELIDLASDERKLIAGKVDNTVRSRMHFVDNRRLLLETGSGQGYWVDLQKAQPLAKREDADPESRFAERLADTMAGEHQIVPLPGALERPEDLPDGDRGWRFRSSTAAGVRAAVDVSGVLVIDPLDQPNHFELGFRSANVWQMALADKWVALDDSRNEEDYRDDVLVVLNLESDDTIMRSQPNPQVWPMDGRLVEIGFMAPDKLLAVASHFDHEPMTLHLLTFDAHQGTWSADPVIALDQLGDAQVTARRPPPGSHVATIGVYSDPEHRVLIDFDLASKTISKRDFGPADHAAWPELITIVEHAAATGFPEEDYRSANERIGKGAIFSRTGVVTRRDPGSDRWTITVPGAVDEVRLSPDQTTLSIISHLPAGLTEEFIRVRLFHDAETGARLWSTDPMTFDQSMTWNFDYADPDGSAWALVRHTNAYELVDARSGERIDFMRGLGPAWRSAPDDRVPTPFLSDHVNEQPLTIRP